MWYPNLLPGKDGLLSSQINYSEDLIVSWQYIKKDKKIGCKYAAFDNYIDFWNFYNKTYKKNRCFNEVVLYNRKQKLRFDLDMEGQGVEMGDKVLRSLITAILKYFKSLDIKLKIRKHFMLFTSHGSTKLSYHLIIDGYYFSNNEIVRYVALHIKDLMPDKYSKWIDLGVYDKNHSLRIYGSYKPGTNRVKRWNREIIYNGKTHNIELPLDEEEDEDYAILRTSLITFVDHCEKIEIELPVVTYKELDISDEHVDAALELLEQMEDGDAFKVDKIDLPFINLRRLRPTHCYCGGYHENQNPVLIIGQNGVLFYCRRSSNKEKLNLGTLSLEIPEAQPQGLEHAQIRRKIFDLSDKVNSF